MTSSKTSSRIVNLSSSKWTLTLAFSEAALSGTMSFEEFSQETRTFAKSSPVALSLARSFFHSFASTEPIRGIQPFFAVDRKSVV